MLRRQAHPKDCEVTKTESEFYCRLRRKSEIPASSSASAAAFRPFEDRFVALLVSRSPVSAAAVTKLH